MKTLDLFLTAEALSWVGQGGLAGWNFLCRMHSASLGAGGLAAALPPPIGHAHR